VVYALLFPSPLPKLVEPIYHHARDAEEVVGGAEAADGEVAAVLHGLVAAGGGHVLRHRCGWGPAAG